MVKHIVKMIVTRTVKHIVKHMVKFKVKHIVKNMFKQRLHFGWLVGCCPSESIRGLVVHARPSLSQFSNQF